MVSLQRIYKVTNLVTNKIYVGKTKLPIQDRLKQHISRASQGLDTHLYNSIRKHGGTNFSIDLIEEVCMSLANELEIFWIQQLDSMNPLTGYNMTRGGDGLLEPCDKTRSKMSESHKGPRNHNFGKPRSESTKRKIGDAHKGENSWMYGKKGPLCHNFGLKRTEETRQKMVGRYVGGKSSRARAVNQLDLEGNLIKAWAAASEVTLILGLDSSGILKCCRGKNKTCGGFKWEYSHGC